MDAAMTASFFNSATYENILDYEGFPQTLEPIWILGFKYSLLHDRLELEDDVRSMLIFTYRKGFGAIGGVGPTSDIGWGCMLRCGQMMLAQALVDRHLTRNWRWKPGCRDPLYVKILQLFQDRRDSCYSIHQIASMGVSEGKAIGEWFGPNTVAQVLRKLAVYDDWSGMVIHVAMDNCVITDDIRELCLSDTPTSNVGSVIRPQTCLCSASAGDRCCHSTPISCSCRHRNVSNNSTGDVKQRFWRPLLLIIPMRLGLSEINPIYFNAIKACFTFQQSVGLIGGKPNNAYWFIGYNESRLFYLDPHSVQPCVDVTAGHDINDNSFHYQYPQNMDISQLDPSVAVGFYCGSEADFEDLYHGMHKISVSGTRPTPLFEVHTSRPSHFPPVQPYSPTSAAGATASDFTVLDEQRVMDSEDEFEIIM